MADVAPKEIDEALFKDAPKDIQDLNARSRKELREQNRQIFKTKHGLTRLNHPYHTKQSGS